MRPSNRVIEKGKVGKARNALEALGEALDFSKRDEACQAVDVKCDSVESSNVRIFSLEVY